MNGSTKALQRAVIKVAAQIKAEDCCEILYSFCEESLSFFTQTQKHGLTCLLLSGGQLVPLVLILQALIKVSELFAFNP